MNYTKHRRALERLYEDTCTISRMGPVKKLSGETVLGPQQIYTEQSCRLSQKALASNKQAEATNDITYETKLFIFPELEIKQGDALEVTHCGRIQSFTAGEPFLYPTHQEISLQRKDRA